MTRTQQTENVLWLSDFICMRVEKQNKITIWVTGQVYQMQQGMLMPSMCHI